MLVQKFCVKIETIEKVPASFQNASLEFQTKKANNAKQK